MGKIKDAGNASPPKTNFLKNILRLILYASFSHIFSSKFKSWYYPPLCGGFHFCHKAHCCWLALLVFDIFHVYKMSKNNSENYVLKFSQKSYHNKDNNKKNLAKLTDRKNSLTD